MTEVAAAEVPSMSFYSHQCDLRPEFVGPAVEFTDLRYAFPVTRRRSGKKSEVVTLEALKTLTGRFGAGRLTAIMGPSGSGKTTLLNILAGRAGKGSIKNSELTGEISLDGRVIDPVAERSRFAYVMSEDSLFSTLTPRESLMYAARLRLPQLTQSERSDKVEALIKSLNISNCADTLIGDERTKGISSGERKRTAVGVELIHDPSLLLLDEPTSGLDSYTAYELVSSLKQISSSGKSIVTTIHQPRSEIFDMFDDIVFLSKGSIIYQGPAKDIRGYFDSIGFQCPPKHNPADFVMNLIQTLSQEEIEEKIIAKWNMGSVRGDIDTSRSNFVAGRNLVTTGTPVYEIKQAELSVQGRILLGREIKNTMRNKQVLGMRFVAAVVMSALFGGVFWMVGSASSLTLANFIPSQVRSYSGAVTFVCIQAMFANVQPILISFPREKPIFIREYSGGSYSATIYFLCKSIVEVPVLAVQSALTILIVYFMMGFSGSYLLFFLGHFLIALASTSLAIMLTSRVSQVKTAMELSPLVFVPQIFFSGIFVKINEIPVVLRWIQYIVPLKYGVDIVYLAELNQDKYDAWAPELLTENYVSADDLWWYILVPIGLILGFRLIGLISLIMKARTTVF
jgi:ABC-type multidrug transport system ATPase subunit